MSVASAPTAAFLFAHPAHFVALGFGAGLARFAPGTIGTLMAIPLALLLRRYTNDAGFVVTVVALLVAGAWAAQVSGRNMADADHGAIVIDEVGAFLVVLFFVGDDWLRVAFAFLLFRFFDIVKPPPIRHLDASLKNGFGVMLDDLVAAGYTLLVLALMQRLFG
ncbi:MAG: phosphatidylglycerophosphatase A [Casimicrobiaceae bacterium]